MAEVPVPSVEKPSEAAIRAFADAFPEDPRAARKRMFGMDCGVVNGNMFGGVFEAGVTLRLPEERVQALVASEEGVMPFTPLGRRWKGYAIVVADRWVGTPELRGWLAEALEHTATLPAKEPKPPKAPKPKKGS